MSRGMEEVWPRGLPTVGQCAERSRAVSDRDIELFTEISGDRNPLHYDEELAKATRFGGIVVQGGITSAILNAVVAEDLPGPGTVFLHVDWSFKAPVRPGDARGMARLSKLSPGSAIAAITEAPAHRRVLNVIAFPSCNAFHFWIP